MKAQFIFFVTLLIIVSCTKDADYYYEQASAVTRSAPNMQVAITKLNRDVVTYTSSKVSITYFNTSECKVTINYGQANQQTFSALEATITEPDNQLKVIKNPGINQVSYLYKNFAKSVISTSTLGVTINPGSISTTATQIIGEEDDQI